MQSGRSHSLIRAAESRWKDVIKMTTLKLKREWCLVLGIMIGGAAMLAGCAFGSWLAAEEKEVNQVYHERVEKYVSCIREQDETRGWIIRSECSSDWKELDRESGLTYTQVGRDLYINSEN